MQGPLFARGATAEVFAWGDRYVLKLFLAGRPPGQARYEASIGALIHAAGVAAPAVVALTEAGGRRGVMYERVAGPSMDKLLEREPWRAVPLAQRFAATHAALHRAGVPALPAQRELLSLRIRAVPLLPERLKQAALVALERLPAGAALCHGDFHPGNLLLASSGPVIIDWENATSGDPAADVARTLLLLRYAHLSQPAGVARVAMRAGIGLFGAAYLRHYCRLTGVAPAQMAAWRLPVAAVRLSEGVGAEEQDALLQLVAHLCENDRRMAVNRV